MTAFAATRPNAHPPPAPVVAGAVPVIAAAPPARSAASAAPAGMPRAVPLRLAIAATGLQVSIQPVHSAPDGRVPLPADPRQAGWLATSAAPGENGTAVIAGHVDDTTGPAAFYGLGSARPGMAITISRADGSTAVFTIVATAVYPKDGLPDEAVYAPTPGPSLRLITCTGWDHHTHGYRDNLVVYATSQTMTTGHTVPNFR